MANSTPVSESGEFIGTITVRPKLLFVIETDIKSIKNICESRFASDDRDDVKINTRQISSCICVVSQFGTKS